MKNKLLYRESVFGVQRTPFTLPRDGTYNIIYNGNRIVMSMGIETHWIVEYFYNNQGEFYKTKHYITNNSFDIFNNNGSCVEEFFLVYCNEPRKRFVNQVMVMSNNEIEPDYKQQKKIHEDERKKREEEYRRKIEEEKRRRAEKERIEAERRLEEKRKEEERKRKEKEKFLAVKGRKEWNDELLSVDLDAVLADMNLESAEWNSNKLQRFTPSINHKRAVDDFESDSSLFLRKVIPEDSDKYEKFLHGAEVWSIMVRDGEKKKPKDVILKYTYSDGYKLVLIKPMATSSFIDVSDYEINYNTCTVVETFSQGIYREFSNGREVYTESPDVAFVLDGFGCVKKGMVLGVEYSLTESYNIKINGNTCRKRGIKGGVKVEILNKNNKTTLVFDKKYRLIKAEDFYDDYNIEIEYDYRDLSSSALVTHIKQTYKDIYREYSYSDNNLELVEYKSLPESKKQCS